MPRVTEVQPYQYALNDSSVTLALVPLSPRNRFISNLEESTNVSTRNTLSRKFSPILNIHREITHPLPAKLPWLRAVTTYLEWRIIAFDPKAISNSDLYEWRAPRDEWYYTLARSAHTCEPMYTRVHDRLHVLCRCGRRKEGARAYIYMHDGRGALRVSFDIYNLFREKARRLLLWNVRESTYEDATNDCPRFSAGEQECFEYSSPESGSKTIIVRFHASSSFTIRKYCSRLKRPWMLYYVRYTRGSLIISSIIFYINICISSCVFEILDERYIVSRLINGRRRWRLSVIFISRKREMKLNWPWIRSMRY